MLKTTVNDLKPRDKFRAAPRGNVPEYTVDSVKTVQGNSALVSVYAERYDRPVMVTTPETIIWAESMVREIEVSCLALTHEGDKPAKMLHDLAKGPRPRGIFCGNCAVAADEAAGF